jgi:hypothetical protein
VRYLRILLAGALLVLMGCTSTVAGTATAADEAGAISTEISQDEGGGSGGEEPTEPTGSADDGPEPSPDELAAGVTDLFAGLNVAWAQGSETGVTYQAEHNHPALAYSAQECIDNLVGITPTYTESIVPDTDTLEPDPGWTIGEGRYADTEFDGYIYTVVSTYTYGDPAVESPNVDVLPLHVAFLEGETYFFFLCEPLE